MIAGCAGGILRGDSTSPTQRTLCQRLGGDGGLHLGGLYLAPPHELVTFAAFVLGLALRLLALRFNWNIPKFVYSRDWH